MFLINAKDPSGRYTPHSRRSRVLTPSDKSVITISVLLRQVLDNTLLSTLVH